MNISPCFTAGDRTSVRELYTSVTLPCFLILIFSILRASYDEMISSDVLLLAPWRKLDYTSASPQPILFSLFTRAYYARWPSARHGTELWLLVQLDVWCYVCLLCGCCRYFLGELFLPRTYHILQTFFYIPAIPPSLRKRCQMQLPDRVS